MEILNKEALNKVVTFSQGVQIGVNNQYYKYNKDRIRFLRIVDYTQDIEDIRYIDNIDNKYNRYIVNEDDVIMVRYGATSGFVGRNIYGVLANNMFKIMPNKNILKSYLYYYLSQNEVQTYLKEKAISSAMPAINFGMFKNLYIPIFDLETQKKIVEVLDKAQELIDKRKEQIEALDELVKSRFIEIFGDFTKNTNNWEIKNFKEFAKIDTNMTYDYEKYADYPHIGIDSIEKNTGRLVGYRTIREDNVKSGKYLFTNKHIIYSKIRPNLNKVALPDFEGLCSADAYPILPNSNNCNRMYLGILLRSNYFLNYILKFSSRTNLPKVNKKQVEGFNAPMPPIELQNQFADFVKQTDKLKEDMEASLKELEDNFNSLMQRAFKGELFN